MGITIWWTHSEALAEVRTWVRDLTLGAPAERVSPVVEVVIIVILVGISGRAWTAI